MPRRWIWFSRPMPTCGSPRTISASCTRPYYGTATRMNAIAAPTRRSRTMSSHSMRTDGRSAWCSKRPRHFDTPREMEALVAWTRKALEEEALHPLLVIAVIHRHVAGDPSFSRWQWAAVARADHAPLAAGRLCLCAVRLAGARDRGKQGPVSTRRSGERRRRSRPRRRIGNRGSAFSSSCLKKQKDALRHDWTASGGLRSVEDDLPLLSLQILQALNERAADDRQLWPSPAQIATR